MMAGEGGKSRWARKKLLAGLLYNGLRHRAGKLFGTPGPFKALTVTVTRRCNSRCVMCNIWRLGKKQEELSGKEILDFLTSPWFSGLVELDLTGGEPLLRKDLPLLVREATVPGCMEDLRTLALATNGLLPEHIERSVRALLDAVDGRFDLALVCSLDGFGETHDKIRGVRGAFERSMKTIEKLVEVKKETPNFRLGLKTTILPQNIDLLADIIAFAEKKGLFHIVSPVLFTEKRFHNLGRKESLDVYSRYGRKLHELYSRDCFAGSHFARIMRDSLKKGIRKDGCSAGMDHVFVEGDGEVRPCPIVPVSMGNIRFDSPDVIFKSEKNRAVIRRAGHYESCRRCFEPGCIRFSQAGEGFGFLRSILTGDGEKIMDESLGHEGLDKYFERSGMRF